MTNDSSSNAPHTGTALPTVPVQTRHYNTNDESAFLAQQAADAKTALQRTVADMKSSVQQAADIRWWTQQYPWYALGAAAVLGFVATTKALAPSNHRTQSAPPTYGQPVVRQSWMAPLFEMIRTTLMSAIIGAVHSSGQQTGQEQAHTEQTGTQATPHR